jgi:SAM-dependent methyltransferase
VWAASSLHHVREVPRLLAGVRAALAPGGVLAAVELEELPRFTAEPVEDRARAAARAAGWNHHPDWAPHLVQAGFTVERHDLVLDVAPSAAAEEFARAWLPRYLTVPGFDEGPAVQTLLDGDLVLAPRALRAVWVAR